tara:strand:- start:223 stop:1218 length:996 start_codon:yes stop_codon:yes gene_type:complete
MKKLFAITALGACSLFSTTAALAAEAGKDLQKVTYLLPAPKTLPAFAPWLIAQHQGYFADEGLEVEFVTGKGGVDVAKQVGAGNAVIGGAIGDTSIIVRANGVPVKSVAVLGAGSLTLVASHADKPVNKPAELKGKVISVMAYTDTTYYSLLGTMRKAGLSRDDADIQAAGPAGVWQLFASGKSEVMAGVPDWVVSARAAGTKVHIMPREEGFNSMAQAILASDEAIKNNPELIQKMVRATLKGMTLIMNETDKAVASYVEANPAFKGKEDQVRQVFDLYNEYVYANQEVPGTMDPERLANVQKFYVSEGIVNTETPLDELYTNQFVGGGQ